MRLSTIANTLSALVKLNDFKNLSVNDIVVVDELNYMLHTVSGTYIVNLVDKGVGVDACMSKIKDINNPFPSMSAVALSDFLQHLLTPKFELTRNEFERDVNNIIVVDTDKDVYINNDVYQIAGENLDEPSARRVTIFKLADILADIDDYNDTKGDDIGTVIALADIEQTLTIDGILVEKGRYKLVQYPDEPTFLMVPIDNDMLSICLQNSALESLQLLLGNKILLQG